MPWSDEQYAIVEFLGLPFTDASLQLVLGKMSAVTADEFIETVKGYLTELDTLEGAIATKRLTADPSLPTLKTEARKFAARMALALDLEVRNDVF